MAERLIIASPEERRAHIEALTNEQAEALRWDWEFWARPEQLPPKVRWLLWIIRWGRGTGKTRVGSEWVRKRGPKGRVGMLVAANPRDARDYMVEGPSGILRVSPKWERPHYEPSKLLLTWPNGAIAHIRSAEDPEGLRGPSLDWAWCDELAKWQYLKATWDNLRFALREGLDPQTVITTTPKPLPLLRALLGNPAKGIRPMLRGTVEAPRASTYRNAANLAQSFLEEMEASYEGTILGRQELHGDIIEDVEGALWTAALFDETRAGPAEPFPTPKFPLPRVLVGVDPPAKSTGAECGIIVGGAIGKGVDQHGYVLDDFSLRGSPNTWGEAVVRAYHEWSADGVVAEANNGGEMVEAVIANIDPRIPVVLVHASRAKRTRAEPVAQRYERRRIHNLGRFPELEDQCWSWVPDVDDDSPDRMDALVWVMTKLLDLDTGPDAGALPVGLPQANPWDYGVDLGGYGG